MMSVFACTPSWICSEPPSPFSEGNSITKSMNCALCTEAGQETRRAAGLIFFSSDGKDKLFEFEIRLMLCTICQFDNELTASASPRPFGLPIVDVGAGRGVVGQAAVADRDGLFDCIHRH